MTSFALENHPRKAYKWIRNATFTAPGESVMEAAAIGLSKDHKMIIHKHKYNQGYSWAIFSTRSNKYVKFSPFPVAHLVRAQDNVAQALNEILAAGEK